MNTKVEGWIEKLYIDYTGRYVRKGEPMAELYSPELLATQEEYLSILKWRSGKGPETQTGAMISRDAEVLVEATKKRLQRFDISEAQIRETRADRESPEDPDHLQPHQRVCRPEDGSPGDAGHARRETL